MPMTTTITPAPNATRVPSAQAAREPAGFLYRFEAKLEFIPIGLVPEGIRMTIPFEGEVTKGEFLGARVWGVDHLLLRPDGVGIIDAQKTISRGNLNLYEHVHGYCMPPEGMDPPPLEAVLAPGFEWPDVLFPIQGFSMFRAATPELAYLNRAFAAIEGWANFVTGRNAIETRIVERSGAVAGPTDEPS